MCPAAVTHTPLVCKAAPEKTESESLIPPEALELFYFGLADVTHLLADPIQSDCAQRCVTSLHLLCSFETDNARL